MTESGGRVLVAGGGIVGIACAYYLRREGFEVTVIDQGRVGGACSSGNCGLVCPGHVLPLTMPGAIRVALSSLFDANASFRVKPQWRADFFRWFWEFARRCSEVRALEAAASLQPILEASADEYHNLMNQHDFAAEYRETGTLFAFKSTRAFEHFVSGEVRLIEKHGVRTRLLGGNEIHALDPSLVTGLAGGVHFQDDAYLNPDRLCQGWTRVLEQMGVRILENLPITEIRTTGGEVCGLETAIGTQTADCYIFALGAWSRSVGDRLGISLPVEPGKGYSLLLDRPDPCPSLPVLFPETRVVATPFESGLRLGSIMEFSGFNDALPGTRLQQLVNGAEAYIRLPKSRVWREPWYGWRPMTWDSLPVIGRVESVRNAIIATGHNMLGTTLAPATGKLVADMVTERRPFINAAPYAPARFQ